MSWLSRVFDCSPSRGLLAAPLALFVVAGLLLQGCGFQPVYGTPSDTHIEIGTYLSSVQLKPRGGDQMINKFKINLEDLLNPTAEKSLYGKAFRLEFNVNTRKTAALIDRRAVIDRYELVLTSNYILFDAETNEVLTKGSLRRKTSFFNAPDKYAAYTAEKDAIDRVIAELAEDYKIRLTSYFSQYYKLTASQS